MPDEPQECGIRIKFIDTVYRAPQFSRAEIDYLQGIVSGRLCRASRLEQESGQLMLERNTAGELYRKLEQLSRYMDAANALEIECHAPGHPPEILKPIIPPLSFDSG